MIKEGVKLTGLKPEMLWGATIVASVYEAFERDCIITEVTGGKHSRGSLHYVGQAVDFRIKHLCEGGLKNPNTREMAQQISDLCRKNLGENFDVVLHTTHIHVEFQPK
jgi:hypothetical protein